MTMLVTAARMSQLCPQAKQSLIVLMAPALEAARTQYGVTTPKRAAYFMAQIGHETAHFTTLEEDLHYRAETICRVWPRLCPRSQELAGKPEKLANAAYGSENKPDLGNGPEASGEGWKFRGGGPIQLTGKFNYQKFGRIAGFDLVSNPEIVRDPVKSAPVALAYWHAQGCNERADVDDVAGVTRRINPAMTGFTERQALTTRALPIFV